MKIHWGEKIKLLKYTILYAIFSGQFSKLVGRTLKMRDMKMQDWKMWHKPAVFCRGWKMWHKNTGLENAGMEKAGKNMESRM